MDPEPLPRDRSPEPSRSRGWVLLLRLALLGVAASAAVVGLWIGRSHGPAIDMAARYQCPMHPDVVASTPGPCPICGMDLERLAPAAAEGATGSTGIEPSTYLNTDIIRTRGIGPDTPAPAWIEDDGSVSAILYDDELAGVSGDAAAVFFEPSGGSPELPLRALAGSEAWDRSTSRVRFRVDDARAPPSDARPPPGQIGRVRLTARGGELPLIASSAVLEGADGPYVMVLSGDGRMFSKRAVQVGKTFGGMTFVLSGLGPRERVLTRSAFFVDAERRLRREQVIGVKR